MKILLISISLKDIVAQGTPTICSKEGNICKDCQNLVKCEVAKRRASLENSDTTPFKFKETSVDTCQGDFVCDEWTLSCVRRGICRSSTQICPKNNYEQEEVFPDPYSCVLYHGCQGESQEDYQCGEGISFDLKTLKCGPKIEDNPFCTKLPILCEKAGDKGSVGDSDFEYECVEENKEGEIHKIYPIITRKGDTTPSATDSSITTPTSISTSTSTGSSTASSSTSASTSTPISTPSSTPSITPTTTPTPTPTITTTEAPCPGEGLYPDPNCCNCFYSCHSVGGGHYSYNRRCCRYAMHYDGTIKKCVIGDCTPACQS